MNLTTPSSKLFFFFIVSFIILRLIETASPHPTYRAIYYERGLSAEKQNHRAKAIKYYKKAIYHNPQNPLPYEQLGLIAKENGQFEGMINYYMKAASFQSHNAEIYSELGMYFFKRQDFAKAIESFRQASSGEQTFYYLGLAYEQQGFYREAIDSLTPVSRNESPLREPAIYHIGISYYKMGDLINALGEVNALTSFGSYALSKDLAALIGLSDPHTHYRLGLQYFQQPDFGKARDEVHYLKAVNEKNLARKLQKLLDSPTQAKD